MGVGADCCGCQGVGTGVCVCTCVYVSGVGWPQIVYACYADVSVTWGGPGVCVSDCSMAGPGDGGRPGKPLC